MTESHLSKVKQGTRWWTCFFLRVVMRNWWIQRDSYSSIFGTSHPSLTSLWQLGSVDQGSGNEETSHQALVFYGLRLRINAAPEADTKAFLPLKGNPVWDTISKTWLFSTTPRTEVNEWNRPVIIIQHFLLRLSEVMLWHLSSTKS